MSRHVSAWGTSAASAPKNPGVDGEYGDGFELLQMMEESLDVENVGRGTRWENPSTNGAGPKVIGIPPISPNHHPLEII